MKNVRIIPAIPKENIKFKVAAYCRVSTSGPEQQRRLEIQIKTYTKMIRNHSNWLFAGVFHDVESGLRRSGRTGLDKMQESSERQNRLHHHQVNQQGVKRHAGGFEDYKIFPSIY